MPICKQCLVMHHLTNLTTSYNTLQHPTTLHDHVISRVSFRCLLTDLVRTTFCSRHRHFLQRASNFPGWQSGSKDGSWHFTKYTRSPNKANEVHYGIQKQQPTRTSKCSLATFSIISYCLGNAVLDKIRCG